MSDYLLIYIWSRLDNIGSCFLFIFLATALCCLWLCWLYISSYEGLLELDNIEPDERRGTYKKYLKIMLPIAITSFCILMLLPSKKDAVLIYTLPKVINSQAAGDTMEIINQLPAAIRKQLEEYLNE